MTTPAIDPQALAALTAVGFTRAQAESLWAAEQRAVRAGRPGFLQYGRTPALQAQVARRIPHARPALHSKPAARSLQSSRDSLAVAAGRYWKAQK